MFRHQLFNVADGEWNIQQRVHFGIGECSLLSFLLKLNILMTLVKIVYFVHIDVKILKYFQSHLSVGTST
jgi:hypothetical protein